MTARNMLAVDVGGTFTDVVGVMDGVIQTIKLPTDRNETERSVIAGAESLGAEGRVVFNHASTVGLNAMITRRLPKVGFLTTYGHRDMLDIARSWRPLEALTDLGWRRSFGDSSRPLVPRYLRRGVKERMRHNGSVLVALDEQHARGELERFRRCGIEGLAICLLNAYANPEHEERLRGLACEVLGDIAISISSTVSPVVREYPRASTTVIDVFMKIIYGQYLVRLDDGLRDHGFDGQLNFADSAAMLVSSDYAMHQPYKLVFAGPAAGATASAHFGTLIGDERLLCCDVGGTSCDVSLVNAGQPSLTTTFELEPDMLVNSLAVSLDTLGAGGGSVVASLPSGEIAVGPESAGADPGPACYGRGGIAPTMTDAFLLMGLLDAGGFNAGRMKPSAELALQAFLDLDSPLDLRQRISYAYRIALNNVAEGLIDVAIGRGVDPRDYSLFAFGAAGPLMLPGVLEQVRVRRLVVPPYPGLFSALGLLSSDLVYSDAMSVYTLLTPEAAPMVTDTFRRMEERLRAHIPKGEDVTVRRTFDGRLVGQSWELPFVEAPTGEIDADGIESMVAAFHDAYGTRYGNRFDELGVEGVTYRLQMVASSPKVEYPLIEVSESVEVEPDRMIELRYLQEESVHAGEYTRAALKAGHVVRGPAVIREPMSTTHLLSGQTARIGRYGEIVITQDNKVSGR
jgi:N-methylhydantoinase A